MENERINLDEYRARFLSVYANIPLSVRDDIVLVIDEQPITWNVAYLEILSKGQKADEILRDLIELELIK